MGRYPTLRTKLRRDIGRSWPLFTALAVTVMLGIALFAASNNAYLNLQGSYDNAFAVEGFPDLFVTDAQATGYARSARSVDGVQATRARVQQDLPLAVPADGQTKKLLGRIVGYPAQGRPDVASLTSLTGSANPGPGTVLVEQHMAEYFHLGVGDKLTVTTAVGDVPVTVAGTVASAEYLWPAPSRQQPIAPPGSFGVLFVSDSDAQRWTGAPDNQALILLTDSARGTSVGDAALAQLQAQAVTDGASEVLTRAEQPSNSVLQEDITGFQQMAVAFPVLFLTAAALAMYVLLTRRVAAERQVIGTLRAAGFSGRTLAWHYMSYGLAAGVIGAVIGLPVGMLLAGAMSQAYVSVIGLPDQLLSFSELRVATIVTGIAFALLASALAAVFPAFRAAHVAPAEAMRGEAPDTRAGRSWVERIIPGVGSLPVRWRMILRSIGRHGSRTVFTAAGVAIALILVLASVGLLQTMDHVLGVQFDQVDKSDAQILYAQPVTQADLDTITAVDGINAAEAVTDQPVSISYGGSVYSTQLTAFAADTTMHGFIDESGNPVPLPGDGILIDESIKDKFPDLSAGDQVQLSIGSAAAPTKVTATVRGFTYEPLGTFVYSSQDWLHSVDPGVPADSILATASAGADIDKIQNQVSQSPGVLAFIQTSALQQMFSQFAGLFNVFIGAMLILGAAMAFAIIFTTMSVNIVERERELATMRAAGVRFRTLAALVGGENTLVAALGVIPGLVLGVVTAAAMLQTYSNDQFTLPLYVAPLTLVLAAAAIMAVAVLSQWPGLRAMRRMNIAQVVRERSA